jgi:flagellar biosynthesis/type III secretory pathway M-ring protein FliF/YscJ
MRNVLRGLQSFFQIHGFNSVDASKKALAAIYGMVQQQAAMLSFVEAFWIMGVIFLLMLPLLFLLRNARSLHPHTRKAAAPVGQPQPIAAKTVEPEEELAGVGH